MDQPTKSGQLFKRGRGLNYSFIKPWDRRYVVLNLLSGELVYFEEKGTKKIEKGRLFVGGAEVKMLEESDAGKPFSFEIFFKPRSPGKFDQKKVGITLAAKSMGELVGWVEALQQATSAPPVDFSGKGLDGPFSNVGSSIPDSIDRESTNHTNANQQDNLKHEDPATGYSMNDIDDEVQDELPYVSPPQPSVDHGPLHGYSSSMADIDGDDVLPLEVPLEEPIIIQPGGGVDPPAQPASGSVRDVDDDSYSHPLDIDDLAPAQQEAQKHNLSVSIPAPLATSRKEKLNHGESFGSTSIRETPRSYISPTPRSRHEVDTDGDWWEPGLGSSSSAQEEVQTKLHPPQPIDSGVSDSMEIKIKIRRIEHGYTRLSRRLYASRYSADFTTGSSISDIRNLLSYVYNGNVGGVDVERPDWSALFAAMFILEENEPAPPPKGRLADLDVVMLAEIQPGGYREEFIVRPWDLLPDIANALAAKLNLPEAVVETALNRGMGKISDGKKFSLYPKAVELLLDELSCAERSILVHESMLLNAVSEDGVPIGGGRSTHSDSVPDSSGGRGPFVHDYNVPYVPSFLGHVDDEFRRADEDGDGFISRAEWRKWIGEKERLIRSHNNEKAYLIKEVRSLRKALTPVQKQAHDAIMQLEARLEIAEGDLAERTKEHRKTLAEAAKAKIRIAQLEAIVEAYGKSGVTPQSMPLSIGKLNNAVTGTGLEDPAVDEDVASSAPSTDNKPNVKQQQYEDSYGMNENNYAPDNIDSPPPPPSWVRNYIPISSEYSSRRQPELTKVPPSIAEVNRHKSGEGLSERGTKDLRTTLERLGRDTTLQVVSGVYPSSSNSPKNDLSHWDTLALQANSKARSRSPGKDHVLHAALRSSLPSPMEKIGLNSKGNLSIITRIFEESEKKRLSGGSPHQIRSPEMAQSQYRKGVAKDYMAPTVTSQGKEKPGVAMPSTASRGTSGWF